ncbi:hypothetical protein GSI_03731 [Ganoderma sinense ZZ0214-1]|uniref:F-box domain-containing protein n=1 Tax=Ganoderma sinense ZZ0214-1 TaxID=1077348 RepID=A0A2G8SJT4_9APHY|nr:hypothetical protein GSI_03731 [Ganoderma sinense ZZ0214-1]
MVPSIIPSVEEVTTLLSKFNTSLDSAIRERSFSLEQVQDVTAAVARSLSTLHRYHNTLLPIGTLPPEVLIRVFDFVVSPPSDVHDVKPHKQAKWAIALTHVCSLWREIALSTSRLWSQIVDEDLNLARLFLQRSRSTPIRFYASLSMPPSEPNYIWQEVVQNYPHRVHELHARVSRMTPTEDFLNSLSTPMPALEFLTIQSNNPALLLTNPFPTPPLILGGQPLHHLKALILSRLAPFMPGNPLPNLVNLQLYGLGLGVLTAHNLLHLLANCPRLETFELLSPPAGLFFDFDERPTAQPVPLRALKALWMRDLHITPALALLCRLELPATTTVRLANLADVSQRYERPTFLLLPAGRRSPFKHLAGLTHLDILEDPHGAPGGGGASLYAPLYFIAHGARAAVWLHVAVTTGDAHARDRLFWNLLDMLPTEGIAALRVSARAPACFARIEWVLKRTPALTSLTLRCGDAQVLSPPAAVMRWQNPALKKPRTILDDVASALAPRGSGSAAVRVSVPLLRALAIEVGGTWDADLAHGLVRALAARKLCGHPLRSVACGAKRVDDRALAERLREQVEIVKVVERKLWEVVGISAVWMVENDYWSLYLRESRYGWELPHDTYESNS